MYYILSKYTICFLFFTSFVMSCNGKEDSFRLIVDATELRINLFSLINLSNILGLLIFFILTL